MLLELCKLTMRSPVRTRLDDERGAMNMMTVVVKKDNVQDGAKL
jgi:hypothetical protein